MCYFLGGKSTNASSLVKSEIEGTIDTFTLSSSDKKEKEDLNCNNYK